MTSYDQQYTTEDDLFGAPYAEFDAFVGKYGKRSGRALDLGCGQGRDALMLAQHGYHVIGVDGSQVGIEQMEARAQAKNLQVKGIVADFYQYQPDGLFDLIVLDSILHFGAAEKAKELALLDSLPQSLAPGGYLCLFIHKSASKEKALKSWFAQQDSTLSQAQDGYLDYTYHEKSSGFQSSFQYYMLIMQKKP